MRRFVRTVLAAGLAVGVGCGAWLALGADPAAATEIEFRAVGVGSIQSVEIDSNGDGIPASYGSVTITGLEGATSADVAVETLAPQPGGCLDGAGDRADLLSGRGFFVFDTGDLLLFEYQAGGICSETATGKTTFAVQGEFIGGTGPYSEAEGGFEAGGRAVPLLADAAGRGAFALAGEFIGTISLP